MQIKRKAFIVTVYTRSLGKNRHKTFAQDSLSAQASILWRYAKGDVWGVLVSQGWGGRRP